MTTETQSVPMILVSSLYNGSWAHGGKSWRRLNSALQQVLNAAVESRCRFAEEDFIDFGDTWGFEFWGGFNTDGGESWYRRAIEYRNPSAQKAVERWLKRKPIRYCGKPIYVGTEIPIGRKVFEVTSWLPDDTGVIACAYTVTVDGREEWPDRDVRTPTARRRLSRADIRQLSDEEA